MNLEYDTTGIETLAPQRRTKLTRLNARGTRVTRLERYAHCPRIASVDKPLLCLTGGFHDTVVEAPPNFMPVHFE
ncbi:hypothetical protein [Caballeronia sp. GACF4]|uniref:hypothetical protein n=1 Tax=Caballeronia sp. GACF4 TaxID=2921763 RepID=UPI0020295764|nr:hypothetical protein [Caballeronia sp. GACF4]